MENAGIILKKYRIRDKRTLAYIAGAAQISKTYLSKIENNKEVPSPTTLDKLVRILQIDKKSDDYLQLISSLGYYATKTVSKEVSTHMDLQNRGLPNQVQNTINVPNDVNVLYSDAVFVTTSRYGVVFDFAQKIGPTNQLRVVSRIGISKEHAEELLKVITKQLKSPDKSKNSVQIN